MNETQLKDLSSKFDLHTTPPEGTLHSFVALELTNEENMRAFVGTYRPLMKALDDRAVAAYFANWLSTLALAVQYSLTFYLSVPVINLSNLQIHLIPANGYCRVAFSLKGWRMTEAPIDEVGREAWRDEVLVLFYRDTMAPLLNKMAEVGGLPMSEVWGQLPTKFNYYIEILAKEMGDPSLVHRLYQDYQYLVKDVPAEVFGISRNPFQVLVRTIEDIADPDKNVQMRNRCCLYYRTDGGSYCYTCPRLKEEERAARRTNYREQTASAKE
ncbi:(2Fe-2S)-binding protein [Paenibacillus sp. 19GGS1-52]|uniref:(2Fe-2S)-binding protein n=1 Tax=Paenibacillus sp. 19GGS1-52 TaxID=2758563 RepID=UPI001EFB04E1|nr:(2Fe-2S)-binding protein [Paenibacillus sp. 19GGS1-52]ULO10109.1 (2Fe-2S)-binding protein [Paenibacillus sp. 19GGS1-52]